MCGCQDSWLSNLRSRIQMFFEKVNNVFLKLINGCRSFFFLLKMNEHNYMAPDSKKIICIDSKKKSHRPNTRIQQILRARVSNKKCTNAPFSLELQA